MGEKIVFTPIPLKFQKPTDVRDCYLELLDGRCKYYAEFYADEPIIADDADSGFHSVYNKYEIVALKRNIAGIEKSFTSDKKWVVYIIVSGFNSDIKVFFKLQSQAQELFDKIENWLSS